MNIAEVSVLILEIQIVTASGALSPGPLTAATLGSGIKYGYKGGLLIAFGHMIIEFPLVILIGLGLMNILNDIYIHIILMLLGASALFYFGYIQIRSSEDVSASYTGSNPMFIGLTLSLFNIYFLIWWASIGSLLIYSWIRIMGFATLPIFYILHVWMDFIWLAFISHLAKIGVDRCGGRHIKIINNILGSILFIFGGYFLLDALTNILQIL